MWWKKNKRKVIIPLVIIAVLAAAFFLGTDAPDTGSPSAETAPPASAAPSPTVSPSAGEGGQTPVQDDIPAGGEMGEDAGSVPSDSPSAADSEDGGEYTCTISISCADAIANIDRCDAATAAVLPKDGWMLRPVTVSFAEGESVFDVLERVCRENGIHMEYSSSAGYGSAYIEGIGNLYEFDAGELSGWLYSVNGWYPNYGCSRYQLENGDTVCWVYSVDKTSYNID